MFNINIGIMFYSVRNYVLVEESKGVNECKSIVLSFCKVLGENYKPYGVLKYFCMFLLKMYNFYSFFYKKYLLNFIVMFSYFFYTNVKFGKSLNELIKIGGHGMSKSGFSNTRVYKTTDHYRLRQLAYVRRQKELGNIDKQKAEELVCFNVQSNRHFLLGQVFINSFGFVFMLYQRLTSKPTNIRMPSMNSDGEIINMQQIKGLPSYQGHPNKIFVSKFTKENFGRSYEEFNNEEFMKNNRYNFNEDCVNKVIGTIDNNIEDFWNNHNLIDFSGKNLDMSNVYYEPGNISARIDIDKQKNDFFLLDSKSLLRIDMDDINKFWKNID